MANGSNLVIVESPSKAKTIGKYLGAEYVVKASMGHLRDLPKSTMGVDIEGGFVPEYLPLENKGEIIEDLRKSAKKASRVYLATDPDREGEAISWHLKELLQLPEEKTCRVTFNEITKKVVTESIANPRAIDYNLVDAQQARRLLDRIVGYQLSPLLWKKIRRGLSAGRVQSVATRLVVDRENEIRAFQPREYWSLEVVLDCIDKAGSFTAKYFGKDKKIELENEAQVDQVLEDIEGELFTVASVKRADKRRSAAPPFTTSTLQQEASRKLNMTPKRTMAIAQQLYEGIDVAGEGTLGLITYMRTDSLRLSTDAMAAAADFIKNRYGASYYYGKFHTFKTKSGAQDAHEAIRPTHVELDPERIRKSLTSDQYRLYKLIWSRFLASQMADAIYDTVSIDTVCAGHTFRSAHQQVKFSGFLAVYEEGRDEEEQAVGGALPDLQPGDRASCRDIKKEQHFTQPPARYTEATLVEAMEEKGVGRPSTILQFDIYFNNFDTFSMLLWIFQANFYLSLNLQNNPHTTCSVIILISSVNTEFLYFFVKTAPRLLTPPPLHPPVNSPLKKKVFSYPPFAESQNTLRFVYSFLLFFFLKFRKCHFPSHLFSCQCRLIQQCVRNFFKHFTFLSQYLFCPIVVSTYFHKNPIFFSHA